MKKLNVLFLFPLLFSTSCSSSALPFKEGDSAKELLSFLKQKNVKYDHSTYAISVFQYENQNYIVTQSYSEENILKIKGYPNQNHSENDFYRLRFGMDLYEIAEIVGGPLTRNYASNGIRMIYPIKDNQYAMVDFFDYCEHIFYSGYFWFFTQDGEIKIGDD